MCSSDLALRGAPPIAAFQRKIRVKLSQYWAAGRLDESFIDAIATFANEAVAFAEDRGATEIHAFATSAIRDASNGDYVVQSLMDRTGLNVVVLDGRDEARLTFLAARRWFGWSAGDLFVVDIGGGSLELAAGANEEPDVAVSLPLGAARLTSDFISADPATSDEITELRRHARVEIARSMASFRRMNRPQMAVATSKTLQQLTRIGKRSKSDSLGSGSLNRKDLGMTLAMLADLTRQQRAALQGVSKSRAEQLLAGAIVAEAVLDLFELDSLELCPWALREGVILRRMDGVEQ